MLARLLRSAAIVTAVMSLATFADNLHRLVELFSHFRLQYFLAAATLAVLFALQRNRHWAAGMLLLCFVNATPLATWYWPIGEDKAVSGTTISLLQANLFSQNGESDQLLSLIVDESPDIIFLQEVTAAWAGAMSALEKTYPHSYVEAREDNFGIAVYSKQPLIGVETIESPPFGLPTLLLSQNMADHKVVFVATHPPPPLGRDLTHARNAQLARIADLMNSMSGPKVLVGDLNTSMWGHHYEKLTRNTGLRNTRRGFGVIPTWPRHLPFAAIPIDHCLVSDEFRVTDMRAGRHIGSDHKPLLITLELRP